MFKLLTSLSIREQDYSRCKSLIKTASLVICPKKMMATEQAAAVQESPSQKKHIDVGTTKDTSIIEPAHIKSIVEQIAQLKFYEVTILNEALKRELKIPDVQRVVAASSPGQESDEGTSAGVKSSFTVKLTKFDDTKKVALIKEIKKLIEGINLVEAKRFVEECPKVIKANLTKEEAEALQKQLEAAGGTVKLE